MKKFLISACTILFLVSLASAQTSTWNQDFQKAMALSHKTGKPVLVNFSGSDWCTWCMKLDKEVFSRQAFKKYAKKNLVLILVDSPNYKKLSPELIAQNEELKNRFAIEGFPTIVLLDSTGKTLGRTGYMPGGPDKYVANLKQIIAGPKKP